jgi:quaternary ammonium compound-resistance protein SugE
MAWVYLCVAGCFEVAWAVAMKFSDNFTRPAPTLLTAISLAISMWLLSVAMKSLPLGTAYAVWTGIGAVGTAAIGMLFLKDPATPLRIACMALIVIGILGLRAEA